MKTIVAVAAKDVKLLLRDRAGAFFVFFLPLLFGTFFGVIFSGGDGGGSPLALAVVDLDRTPASRAFVEHLAGTKALEITETASLRQAEDLVRRGKRLAYVVIPRGFEEDRDRLFLGRSLRLQVGVDPSRTASAALLEGVLTRCAFQEFQALFTRRSEVKAQARRVLESLSGDTSLSPVTAAALRRFMVELERLMDHLPKEGKEKGGDASGGAGDLPSFQPVRIAFRDVAVKREGPRSSFDLTFPQAVIWVLLGCSAVFGVSLVTERTRGTLLRLRASPAGFFRILAGKTLACFSTALAASLFLLAVFRVVFHVRPNSPLMLLLALACASFAFAGIMTAIAAAGRTEAAAGGIGWAVNLIMAMTGGGMIPLFFMPSWLRALSDFSYVKWTVLAVEGAVWRNFTFSEMLRPCAVLAAVGVVFLCLGVFFFRRAGE